MVLPLRRRLAVPLIAGLLALFTLTACGGDDDGGGSADDDGGGNESTSEPADRAEEPEQEPSDEEDAAPVDPADQALIESALLTLQDFPVGWESAPAEDDGEDREGREEITDCLGIDYEDLYSDDDGSRVESPDFTSENDDEVSQSISIAPDEARMTAVFEIGSSPEFRDCFAESLSEAVAESTEESGDDVTVGEITLNDLSVGSFGDEVIAFRVTIPVEAEGLNLEVKFESATVRVGRAQTTVTSNSIGSGLSTEELSGFVQTAVQRLEGALGEG